MWTKRKHRRDTQERGSWRNASNVGDGFEGTEQIKKNKVERGAGQRTGVKKYIWDNSTWVVYWGELQFVGQLHGSRCGVDHVDQHWATGEKRERDKNEKLLSTLWAELLQHSLTCWPFTTIQLHYIYIYIYPTGTLSTAFSCSLLLSAHSFGHTHTQGQVSWLMDRSNWIFSNSFKQVNKLQCFFILGLITDIKFRSVVWWNILFLF